MEWGSIGNWIKDNGLPVIGALLTGGSSAALATGISLIQSATGETDPEKAIMSLKNNPEAMIRLKELTIQDEDNIRKDLREIKSMELLDKQREHEQTQLTHRNSDNAEGGIKWNRPLQAWFMLFVSTAYLFIATSVEWEILTVLLAIPFGYNGLRSIDKRGSFKIKELFTKK